MKDSTHPTLSIDYQAILARHMIHMIRHYPDDATVLEYLESFAFSLARMLEDKGIVSWDNIASICDQRYYSLRQGDPIPLDTRALDECERQIYPYLPPQAQEYSKFN